MSREFETVAIWLSCFPSEARLDSYMDERYFDDDREEPLSDFAADQGEMFYDHDFVECGYRTAATARELLEGHSFSKSYLAHVEAAWNELPPPGVNSVILVWNNEISSPRSVKGKDYELVFIGSFSCDTRAGEVEA